jgi:hypothetical protein
MILLVASVGQDSGETPKTLLDEEGLFPSLIQHLVRRSLPGPGEMGWTGTKRRSQTITLR